jgi:hypothetical protein
VDKRIAIVVFRVICLYFSKSFLRDANPKVNRYLNQMTQKTMSNQTLNTSWIRIFQPMNTKSGVSPYDLFDYDYRTSVIKKPDGSVVFEMLEC